MKLYTFALQIKLISYENKITYFSPIFSHYH